MQAGRYAPIIASIDQLTKNAILRSIKSYFNLWGFPIGKICLRNTSERLVTECQRNGTCQILRAGAQKNPTNSTVQPAISFSPSSKMVYTYIKTPM
jgi:hypothetical protein